MAELFFPQFQGRRPQPEGTVGGGSRAAEIAAQGAGAAAGLALRASNQAQSRAQQQLGQMQQSLADLGQTIEFERDFAAKEREIRRRERLVLQETRAQRALISAKQSAQNEIDLYLTSPDSTSHSNPEEIPERVGAILGEHANRLQESLVGFDPVVLENAAFDYLTFGQNIVPGARKEKTSRIRDQALAGATEFAEVKKKEFFKAHSAEDRQRIADSVLGRMELLREQGYITAQEEENFQISFHKEILNESIAERRRVLTLDTPKELVQQLYADIEATSLSPTEKEQQVQSLNSHMSYLLNQDAAERNRQEAERRRYEEEQLQTVYDVAFDGKDPKGALERLDRFRRDRVIDTQTYMANRNKLLKLMPTAGGRLKYSDKSVLISAVTAAEMAGTQNSAIQSFDDITRVAEKLKDHMTESDLEGFIKSAAGSLRRDRNELEQDQDEVVSQSEQRFKAWFTEAQSKFGASIFGATGEDDYLVTNAIRDLSRFRRDNPQATPQEIEIRADQILVENQNAVNKLWKDHNRQLWDKSIGIGITTVPQLQDELAAGRITQSEFNDLAELVVLGNKYESALGGSAAPSGGPTLPGVPPAGSMPGVPPKPKPQAQQQGPGTGEKIGNAYDAGKSWLGERWNEFSDWQKETAEKQAEALGLGGYLGMLKGIFGGGEEPPPAD